MERCSCAHSVGCRDERVKLFPPHLPARSPAASSRPPEQPHQILLAFFSGLNPIGGAVTPNNGIVALLWGNLGRFQRSQSQSSRPLTSTCVSQPPTATADRGWSAGARRVRG